MNEQRNVVLARRFSEDNRRRIASVDPSIRVVDVSDVAWYVSGRRNSGVPSAPQEVAPDGSEAHVRAMAELARAEVIIGGTMAREAVARMPRLRWVHLISAGNDYLADSGLLESEVIITTSKGCGARSMAEYVIGAVLMHAKESQRYFADKRARKWERHRSLEVHGKTMGVVGLGNVGRETARLASSIGMMVIGTKRSPEEGRDLLSGISSLEVTGDLGYLLARSDFVALTLALTPASRGLMNADRLSQMKPSAYLINVSRGAVVDEDALVNSLRGNRIAGATLDVFASEPLPQGSPLWEIPDVHITPHHAQQFEGYIDAVIELFCENLGRYLKGKEMLNVVDRERGY